MSRLSRVQWNRPARRASTATAPVLVVLVACAGTLLSAPGATAQEKTPVPVRTSRSAEPSPPTLRFLHANRELVRARLDLLRQSRTDRGTSAGEIDPRFLDYQRMLDEILAAQDAISPEEERGRHDLKESLDELARLEARLDRTDSLLAEQQDRLTALQADFTGEQRTALIVLLRGHPRSVRLHELTITLEDGHAVRVPIEPGLVAALERGAVAQLYHGFLEPREQVLDVTLRGDRWGGESAAHLTLTPTRDRLTFLELDVSGLSPAGAPSLRASTWLHEAEVPSVTR